MAKIVDIISYNGEEDLLEIRLNILDQYVDEFIICEANETFSGVPKTLYFQAQKERFAKFLSKIKYYVIDDYPNDLEIAAMADASPNVPKDMHWWHREFYQKESIKKALVHLNDEDICYISDCDEIWKPQDIGEGVYKLRQRAYSYQLNNRSDEKWDRPFVAKYKNIKNECLNHLRTRGGDNSMGMQWQYFEDGGWHFTNMGDAEFIKRKIESYGHQELNVPQIKDAIAYRIENNQDFIGRGFRFWKDESDLPTYILENKDKYKHLWKEN